MMAGTSGAPPIPHRKLCPARPGVPMRSIYERVQGNRMGATEWVSDDLYSLAPICLPLLRECALGITICDPNRAGEGAAGVFQWIYDRAI